MGILEYSVGISHDFFIRVFADEVEDFFLGSSEFGENGVVWAAGLGAEEIAVAFAEHPESELFGGVAMEAGDGFETALEHDAETTDGFDAVGVFLEDGATLWGGDDGGVVAEGEGAEDALQFFYGDFFGIGEADEDFGFF